MSLKKVIIIITLLTLSFGVMGCGSLGISQQEQISSGEYKLEAIKMNEKNFNALGNKQAADIKNIVENYGVETVIGLTNTEGAQMFFYKDENGLLTGEKGNVVGTLQDFKPKDGGNNKYKISYKATTSDVDDKLLYSVIIIITYPPKQEFKLDNFKMFKEILQVVHGKDYDVTSLETSIQEHILTVQPGEIKSRGSGEVNSFNEALSFSNQKDGAAENRLTYILTYKN